MQNQEVIIRNPMALNEDALAECLSPTIEERLSTIEAWMHLQQAGDRFLVRELAKLRKLGDAYEIPTINIHTSGE